jgi:hypothetical protein
MEYGCRHYIPEAQHAPRDAYHAGISARKNFYKKKLPSAVAQLQEITAMPRSPLVDLLLTCC